MEAGQFETGLTAFIDKTAHAPDTAAVTSPGLRTAVPVTASCCGDPKSA
jgi:hypothetical protein